MKFRVAEALFCLENNDTDRLGLIIKDHFNLSFKIEKVLSRTGGNKPRAAVLISPLLQASYSFGELYSKPCSKYWGFSFWHWINTRESKNKSSYMLIM